MNLKRWYLIITGIAFFSLWGNSALWGQNTASPLDYYPVKQGNRWTYQQVYLNKVQLKIQVRVGMPEGAFLKLNFYSSQSPADPITYFIKSQFLSNDRTALYLVNEVGYLGDAADYTPAQPLLMAEMTPGMSWSWASEKQKRKETSKVTAVEPVTVLGKTFDSIVVLTDGTQNNSKYSVKKWYVRNIGLVKQVTIEKGKTVTLELIDYTIKTL